MSLQHQHLHFYDHAFSMQGFIKDPVLVFGFHEHTAYSSRIRRRNLVEYWIKRYQPIGGVWLHPNTVPEGFRGVSTVHEALARYGAREVKVLDYFDSRADLVHDMNEPLPHDHRQRYGTLIDIGSIEHVFDTRQCLANMMELVYVGGHVFIVTVCSGYFNHGFHAFSPECLLSAFEINGFEIRWVTYSTPDGLELDSPQHFRSVLIWFVAQKKRELGTFKCPQQGRWKIIYSGK